jgi:hypothetical protein
MRTIAKMKPMKTLSAHGHPIPDSRLGTLRDSAALVDDPSGMRCRLEEDGYLYIPGALNREKVLKARACILETLASVGELADASDAAVSTGTSQRAERVEDLGVFWRSLCEHPTIRDVTHKGEIVELMTRLFETEVRAYDFLWLRAMHPGRASAYHFDHVYMNRGTENLLTVWTPLGDVELDEGPLALLEGSHQWEDLIADYRGFDVDKDSSRPGHVTLDPVSFAQERGSRLLTAEFRAGDVVIFPLFMLHGSLDNRSPEQRVRLSADTRFQPSHESVDERWVGQNPIGHGGGYATMSGAKPATADPQFR